MPETITAPDAAGQAPADTADTAGPATPGQDDTDAFWAQERARAVAERGLHAGPGACGTCRALTAGGKNVEHEGCAQRATLLHAPDHPSYELLAGQSEEEARALPARFHVPVFLNDCTPRAWVCAVCWGDGWTTGWPCAAAQEHGHRVFTDEHQAEQQHARLRAAAALATEYQVPTVPGRWLSVRRRTDGDHHWSISTSHRVDGERLVWMDERWRPRSQVSYQDMWRYSSAESALAAATRLAETGPTP